MSSVRHPSGLRWGQTWPSLREFEELAKSRHVIPVVRPVLADDQTPIGIYTRLGAGRTGSFILESAAADGQWSRWSFIGVNAAAILLSDDGQGVWHGDAPAYLPSGEPILEVLHAALGHLSSPGIEGLPPLTGGLVGALGWDIIQRWEPTLVPNATDELNLPELSLILTGDLVAYDHHTSTAWLISNAINQDGTEARIAHAWQQATHRVDAMEAQLRATSTPRIGHAGRVQSAQISYRTEPAAHHRAIEATKGAIRDGEVFQAVIAQRFDVSCEVEPVEVYRALRTLNPSPYMYLVNLTDTAGRDFAVVGSSPETLVRMDESTITSFPIAGSRPRGSTAAEDAALAKELMADPKERSEHLMLVDLARNDLTKVSRAGSVEVVEFMAIKRYSHIMHISSTVAGSLRDDVDALDALIATFPAGTLSGAPKPRAVELIDELEPVSRGIYGGTVGYFDFAGNMDMAIAIRTAVIRDGVAHIAAGGGIVADSVPETEYQETVNKAAAVVAALELAHALREPAGEDFDVGAVE